MNLAAPSDSASLRDSLSHEMLKSELRARNIELASKEATLDAMRKRLDTLGEENQTLKSELQCQIRRVEQLETESEETREMVRQTREEELCRHGEQTKLLHKRINGLTKALLQAQRDARAFKQQRDDAKHQFYELSQLCRDLQSTVAAAMGSIKNAWFLSCRGHCVGHGYAAVLSEIVESSDAAEKTLLRALRTITEP